MQKKNLRSQDPNPAVPARRRATSAGLAAGVSFLALSGHWTRPVVQSVLLPAHAQTSPQPEPEPEPEPEPLPECADGIDNDDDGDIDFPDDAECTDPDDDDESA